MQTLDLDITVTRGDTIESRHRVHAAVADSDSQIVAAARDTALVTMWRSCAKPFQVIPALAAGVFETLGWGDEELVVACASHGGEPEHVAIVSKMLDSMGLEEGDLACGPHEPLSARGSKLWRESGQPLKRIHNNCSGKHAAMLALAKVQGWSIEGYERMNHPVQRACVAEVSSWTGVLFDDMPLAVDGCGATVMALPIDRMAIAYARWAHAARSGDKHVARVAESIVKHPRLLGGSDRFDSVLLEETNGQVIAKVGAEGVHSVAVPERGLGITVKVEDGAARAQYAAVIAALQQLDVLSGKLPARLADYVDRPIRNTRGEEVGRIRSGD